MSVPIEARPLHPETVRTLRAGFYVRAAISSFTFVFAVVAENLGLVSADSTPVLVVTALNTILNIPYIYFFDRYRNRKQQVAFYLTVDIVFITITSHYTGGIDAFYTIFAYVIIIVFAGLYLSKRISFIMSAIICGNYSGLVFLEFNEIIPHYHTIVDLYSLPGWLQIVLVLFNNCVIFVLVGFSSMLANNMEQKNIALARANNEIEEKNQTLEQRIRERTEELENMNKELEDSLLHIHEMKDRLYIKEKMSELGKFVADAAHAIKTPLGVVRILLDGVHEKVSEGENVDEDIETIGKQISQLREFVDNLLNFYGPDAMSVRTININNLVEIALSLLVDKKFANDHLEVSRAYAQDLPIIEGDFYQLQHAFLNIISNAMESMPSGGKLSVMTQQNEGTVVINIADTGCAMDQGEIENIFKPFYTTKQGSKGVGLGLAIARRVIERHGGYINVESQREVGTNFTIGLPGQG